MWILIFAYAEGRLASWWIRISEFQFDGVHIAGIKKNGSEELLCLETGDIDIMKLNNDSPEMMVFSVQKGERKTNDDHDENSTLICIYQQCDDILKWWSMQYLRTS